MKKMFRRGAVLLLAIVTSQTLAFNPPVDSKNGLSMEIIGVAEKESVLEPLDFTVRLSNQSASNVSGIVRVWLNDDWQITVPAEHNVNLTDGASVLLEFSALAGKRVLNALYPVHAHFRNEGGKTELHPIAIFTSVNAQREKSTKAQTLKMLSGLQRLDQHELIQMVTVNHKNAVRRLGCGFTGTDPISKASLKFINQTRNGITRRSINFHPPYKDGTGDIWFDYQVELPAETPARLNFHTAVRDTSPHEGKSDGVEFKVIVIDHSGQAKEEFDRFSAARVWEEGSVDLRAYAGQKITLRLWGGPGPHNNTSCDSAYWGDPTLICGSYETALPTAKHWRSREILALQEAELALSGDTKAAHGRFTLDVRGEKFGVALLPGKQGLTDAVIAFTDGSKSLLYRGFQMDIDDAPVGAVELGVPITAVDYKSWFGKLYATHHIATQRGIVKARAIVYVDDAALRIEWQIISPTRDRRGEPRFTRLAIGPTSAVLKRVYAGFGNVIEYPDSFTMRGTGFILSTRHVGADYENGLSLLQASTVFPDQAVYNKDSGCFALETPHNTGFYFIPSAAGAFAAARAYRDICGFKRSPGWKRTAGRMCLDQWGGDYAEAAAGLRLAAKYGLNNSIFVKHAWQRWGYDYRLPEIYPPHGSFDDFQAMRKAAADAGIIFAPHDNYIDFYPDAADYSYDHIIFNADGTPQKAWFNKGRKAQSYRWLPHAFQPWMKDNMRRMRDGFHPDGLFIDVFTAMPPRDYYDREGNYYTRTHTAELWKDAFNTCRRILKRGAPMISEAGHDALIGAIDAVQSDHRHAIRYINHNKFKAAVRTPWHDMATHGRMVLLAGGLGSRYGDMDGNKHAPPQRNYASDDYLSNTIIGGRNPMCQGPFSRNAVMTYWLLHDICNELAHQEFEHHEFGETIMRQHTRFSEQGRVWSNRGKEPWTLPNGFILPEYGFYAESERITAGIVELDGQRAAFAKSPQAVFVDARPIFDDPHRAKVAADVTGGEYLGNGRFAFTVKWKVIEPGIPQCKTFLHVDHVGNELDKGDNIAFQSHLNFPLEKLNERSEFTTTSTFQVPENMPTGNYAIRFGLYNPNRIKIMGNSTANSRIRGGLITVVKKNKAFTEGSWQAEEHAMKDTTLLQRNLDGRMLNFGAVKTDGAFRIMFQSANRWLLIPLPHSLAFSAELDLDKFGADTTSVNSIQAVEAPEKSDASVSWQQSGRIVSLQAKGDAFAYAIEFNR
jgi:hypothetical protein